MFDFVQPLTPHPRIKRDIKETRTVSECCEFSTSMETSDDFEKINKDNTSSLLMKIRYICNKCGRYCKIKEKEID
jgi:hypothetical protein